MSNTKTVMSQAANTQGIPLDITDVFSTYLYKGTGSTQTITNGIDLDGEGGLVWLKARSNTQSNWLYDSERSSFAAGLRSDTVANEYNPGTAVTSVSSSGFTLGTYGEINQSNIDYASWTFRKAPKFFDVVTYTGNGTSQTISHNLGANVGFMVVKKTSATGSWIAWHREFADTAQGRLLLNETSSYNFASSYWNNTAPTSSGFTVGSNANTNASGSTYVAYLFAHNDGDGEFGPSGDQDIIKCGSYTGNGSTTGPVIDLGFEPQWVLIKESSATGNWQLFDNMRGMVADGVDARIAPNVSSAEDSIQSLTPTATGFKINTTSGNMNTNNSDHIYIAIRRGPLAPPESATEVFDIQFNGGNDPSKAPVYQSGFVTDMAIVGYRTGGSVNYPYTGNRLMGLSTLETHNTDAEEAGGTSFQWDFMNGFIDGVPSVITDTQIAWMWKRAPNYFDVVAYTGDGVAGRTVSHNLGVAPEMMWVKRRNSTGHWYVYHTGMTGGSDALHSTSRLNLAEAGFDTQSWKNYDFTDAHFSLDNGADINGSGGTYIAYLFASLDGISKVGSYTGNGTSQTIDCGFTSGARFVLIKCATVGYDWQVFDTERGIVAGNDSKLALNTTQAEQTNGDFIDPSSSGFAVTSSSSMNANGETFIFYAIA